jgi:dihydropyrimidinase
MIDSVIKNGVVVTPSGVFKGGVAVDGGVITAVGPDASLPNEAKRVVDANGNFILPGIVEVHTHVGLRPAYIPFDQSWQDQWESESEEAVYGGITTIRSNLAVLGPYLPVIDQYIEWAEGRSYLDFSIYPTVISDEHIDELLPMAEKGMPSWKCFFDPYQAEEGEQIGLRHTDAGKLWKAFETFKEFGYPAVVMLHAEEYALYHMLEKRLIDSGRTDLKAW